MACRKLTIRFPSPPVSTATPPTLAATKIHSTSFDASTNDLSLTLTGPTGPVFDHFPDAYHVKTLVRHILYAPAGTPLARLASACEPHAEHVTPSPRFGDAVALFHTGDLHSLLKTVSDQIAAPVVRLHPVVTPHPSAGPPPLPGGAEDVFTDSVSGHTVAYIPRCSDVPTLPRVRLAITGMTCSGCVGVVQRYCEAAGARDVAVNLSTGVASMAFAGDVRELIECVEQGAEKGASLLDRVVVIRVDDERGVVTRLKGMQGVRKVRGTKGIVVALLDANAEYENVLAVGGVSVEADKSLIERVLGLSEGKRVLLSVSGMTCGSCVKSVTEALVAVQGAEDVNVDLATEQASLLYPGDESVLIRAIAEGAGKEASLLRPGDDQEEAKRRAVALRIVGMTCMGCVKRATQALESVAGTQDVKVDLDSGLATLSYDGDYSALIVAVADGAGKKAEVVEEKDESGVAKGAGKEASAVEDRTDAAKPASSSVNGEIEHANPLKRPVTLRILGMTCMSCVKRATTALEGVQGAEDVNVDLASGLATLSFSGDESVLIEAIAQGAGKRAEVAEQEHESRGVTLSVQGMTCMKCVGKVTKALSTLETAEEVQVSLDTGLATLTFAGSNEELIQAVASTGKTATIVDADEEPMVELSLSSPTIRSSEHEHFELGAPEDNADLATTQLRVEGMTCASCVGVVEGVLKKLPGVSTAKVNLLAGRATVVHDDFDSSAEDLSAAITTSGYQSTILGSTKPGDKAKSGAENRTFRIDFDTDIQANNALKTLRYLEGIKAATASYNTVTITLDSGVPKSTILRALEVDGGFGKMVLRQSVEAERAALERGENEGPTDVIRKEERMWRKKLQLAAFFFVPIIISSLTGFYLGFPSMEVNGWLHFVLATPVQFISGAGFYRASYYALKKRRATMDCLIALSTSIAYFSSVVVVLFGLGGTGGMALGHAAMFRTSAMILVMVIIGKCIEASSKKQAAQGIADLTDLRPDEAVLYDEKEQVSCFTVIPVKLVDVNDVVKVIAGDKIPVDGDVIEGISAVDESMMTGESTPVPKNKGDHVIGGTVNGTGSMLVRATAVGSDAVLSQIVKLVNDAQTSRAPVEAFADAVSAVFVPAVISISTLVFFVWFGLASAQWIPAEWYAKEGKFFFALLFALETMVIACPCALGLATPTAVMVASAVGTRIGVLFRGGGAAIQAAKQVRTVLFDKTGTLTNGKPEVAAMIMGERGKSATEQAGVILSDLVYLVESQSHHPLAAAITKHIETKVRKQLSRQRPRNSPAYKISAIEEVPGRGMMASINKGEYNLRVGSIPFVFSALSQEDVLTPSEIRKMDRMAQEDGLTLVCAVVNDELACVFGIEDTIRDEANEVIECLHSMGVQTALVTGDSHESGRAVAAKTGIPTHGVHAQALPWTKVSVVEEHEPACFVGDGINDAPALAAASVGIAIGAGAPVAAESASVVVVGSNLKSIVNSLDLARTTFRRVRINFFWAIGYNVLGIPIAAGVLYPFTGIRIPPIVASAAMGLSSSCVVLSSLALYLYKPKMSTTEGELQSRDHLLSPSSNSSSEEIIEVPLLSAQV